MSMKYGVAEGASNAPARPTGEDMPSPSDNIAGMVRRSLSFGGGPDAIGGCCSTPGSGGMAPEPGETPPAPTDAAAGK
jgi:hypothetical protein